MTKADDLCVIGRIAKKYAKNTTSVAAVAGPQPSSITGPPPGPTPAWSTACERKRMHRTYYLRRLLHRTGFLRIGGPCGQDGTGSI